MIVSWIINIAKQSLCFFTLDQNLARNVKPELILTYTSLRSRLIQVHHVEQTLAYLVIHQGKVRFTAFFIRS